MSRIGVVVFPGSNCEYDAAAAVARLGDQAEFVWHTRTELDGIDGVILPGGFAHGDYLRPGALARFSPVMGAVERFAADGGPVLGICNGFQVLVEAGLVARRVTEEPRTYVSLSADHARRLFDVVSPHAHARASDKNSSCRSITSRARTRVMTRPTTNSCANGQIVLRYKDNPNGSRDDIAGVTNDAGNVVGLMPHPERAMSTLLGSADGVVLFEGFLGVKAATPALAH